MVKLTAVMHDLKILPEYYFDVRDKKKTFEIRKNDRNFQVGDIVKLRCFTEEIGFHNLPTIFAFITYITSYEQKENYVVFSLGSVKTY